MINNSKLTEISAFPNDSLKTFKDQKQEKLYKLTNLQQITPEVRDYNEFSEELKETVSGLGSVIQAYIQEPNQPNQGPVKMDWKNWAKTLVFKRGRLKKLCSTPKLIAANCNFSRVYNSKKKIKGVFSVVNSELKRIAMSVKNRELTFAQGKELKEEFKNLINGNFDFKMAKVDEQVVQWRNSFWCGAGFYLSRFKEMAMYRLQEISHTIDQIYKNEFR